MARNAKWEWEVTVTAEVTHTITVSGDASPLAEDEAIAAMEKLLDGCLRTEAISGFKNVRVLRMKATQTKR